jgi:maltose-binding protein MalE
MKTNTLVLAIVLSLMIAPVLSGCSKTSVVYGEDGIVTAVTEAPTFRVRESLIDETTKIVEDMCTKIGEKTLTKVSVSQKPNADQQDESKTSTILKDVKELIGLVENLIDLVPSHSVSISAHCPDIGSNGSG